MIYPEMNIENFEKLYIFFYISLEIQNENLNEKSMLINVVEKKIENETDDKFNDKEILIIEKNVENFKISNKIKGSNFEIEGYELKNEYNDFVNMLDEDIEDDDENKEKNLIQISTFGVLHMSFLRLFY
jgi:hypothetical protein